MAKVWIPALLRELCLGDRIIEVPGSSVRQVIDNLESRCPGIRDRIVEDGELRPELAVSVDGETTQIGLLQSVGEDSEVHILPALGGGCGGDGPLPRPLPHCVMAGSLTRGLSQSNQPTAGPEPRLIHEETCRRCSPPSRSGGGAGGGGYPHG